MRHINLGTSFIKKQIDQVTDFCKDHQPDGLNLSGLLTKKITIGVTGFSRSGKTVFICSLAQALVTADGRAQRRGQGPLAQFGPIERNTFRSAHVLNDVDTHLPQFPFAKMRESLVGNAPNWPAPTEGISRLNMALSYWSTGWFKGLRKMHIELVDYPGEWLVDLPMLEQEYAPWSAQMLALATGDLRKQWSADYFSAVDKMTDSQAFDEDMASRLSDLWTAYLQQAADYGLMLNQPGRLLRPDAMRHSPVLRLVPLPERLHQSPMGQGMAKRFETYKNKVIKPFYHNHFKKLDRQIVLVDVLRALQQGEDTFNEMIRSLNMTLQSFHYGRNGPLSWLTGAKISHLLFAATKADHVTRGDRVNLEQMVREMLMLVDEENQIRSSAERFDVMALASVQATEDRMTIHQPKREVLFGQPEGHAEAGQWDPGGLPLDMPPDWAHVFFEFFKFEPSTMRKARSEGFPAINLGKALDFLIGDEFK